MIRSTYVLFLLIFLGACNPEIKVTPLEPEESTTTGGSSTGGTTTGGATTGGTTGGPTTPAEVTLTRVLPIAAKADDANVTVNAVAEDTASVELFSDSACNDSIGTAVSVGGTATFNLTLSDFDNYDYYAIQTIGGQSSTCSTTPAQYTYAPPRVSGLTLLFPSSPGESSTPQLQAQGILANADVNLYADSSCTTSILAATENGGVAEFVPTLTVGSYQFYATQKVNNIDSNCSTASVTYEYRIGCTAPDLASSPFSRGVGTANDPYIICNGAQFNSIGSNATYKTKNFKLEENIDLSAFNQANFNVIGGSGTCTAGNYFTGTVDGNNKTVSNLSLNSGATSNYGIFGCFNGTLKDINFSGIAITGQDSVGIIGLAGFDDSLATVATVTNVHLSSSTVTGNDSVGGIAGKAINAVISNNVLSNSVTISGINTGAAPVGVGGIVGLSDKFTTITGNTSDGGITAAAGNSHGGIVGKTTNSFINDNVSKGTISGGNKSGGIAGLVTNCLEFNNNRSEKNFSSNTRNFQGGVAGDAQYCTFKSNINTGNIFGASQVGGVFGQTVYATVIGNSASGSLTATGSQAGGLIGYSDNTVINKNFSSMTISVASDSGGVVGFLDTSSLTNCYFTGTLASPDSSSAGVVGGVKVSTISNCYSRATVTGSATGFLGFVNQAPNAISNNYYDIAKAAQASIELGANKIEAVSDAALKTQVTFVNWNFVVVWSQDASGYPELQIGRLPGVFYVSPSGNDGNAGTQAAPWKTLSFAGSEAIAGDTIYLRAGVYDTRLVILNSGNTSDGRITFTNFPGETPIIDGTLVTYPTGTTFGLVEGRNVSNIAIDSLELKGTVLSSDDTVPTGIYFSGRGSDIAIYNSTIYGVENNHANGNAHGILISGDDLIPLTNISIGANTVSNLVLGGSESVVVNGNVDGFYIAGNTIRDNNNIAIDIIGHEGTCSACAPENDRARNGYVFRNIISNISSQSNPAYGGSLGAVGIYVDGGKDIVIERNLIYNSDYGIELASEKVGSFFADRIVVRNNLVGQNKLAGLTMGGYTATRGGCRECLIINNSFYGNNSEQDGAGEIYIQHNNSNVSVANNIMVAGTEGILVYMSGGSNTGISFDYNLYHSLSGTKSWRFNGSNYNSLAAFQVTGLEAHANEGDPLFDNPSWGLFNIQAGSPAINTGYGFSSDEVGLRDYEGNYRVWGAGLDRGAVEFESDPYPN